MNQKDYYQILGVGENASPEQIRQAYRKLAFQYHPDRNKGNPAATEKMKEINEAYATLSDARKRREYDTLREQYGDLAYERFKQAHRPEDIFRGSDINQIFEEFARTFGFRGSDDIFREFYGPGYRSFQFRRGGVFGRGFIFYHQPARAGTGGKEEYSIRWPGIGLPLSGVFGRALKHLLRKTFGMQLPERGKDWKDVITLTPEEAQRGGEVEYQYRKWGKPKNLMVKIPAGIRDGQRIRLRGMGAPGKGGGEAGDLYLQTRIKRSLPRIIRDVFTK
jgi:curved DNA-binding protein